MNMPRSTVVSKDTFLLDDNIASVVREKKPRKRALLPLGKIFSLFSALLLFIGVYKSINLLSLMGYFLLLALFFNSLLASKRLRQIGVKRYFPDHLYAGIPCFYQIEVINREKEIIPPWYLLDDSSDRDKGWAIPPLGAFVRYYLQSRIIPIKRGLLELSALELRGSYPFGLVQKRIWAEQKETVLVLPKIGISRPGALQQFIAKLSALDESGKIPRFHPLAQEEFHGLRVFRPGDNPRAIHWRTSARRGQLIVAEMEDFPEDDLLISLDLGVGNNEELESFISFSATIIHDLCRVRGNRLVVLILGREIKVLDGRAEPSLAIKALRELAVAKACFNSSEYLSSSGKLALLLEELKLPPASLGLRRDNKSSFFEPTRAKKIPSLTPINARKCRFYEPPTLFQEGNI